MKSDLILVVDDLPQNLQILNATLSEAGYRVAAAKSGAQALKALETTRPDLILLDIMMPEMDGLEVCRRLKANPDWADLPVIFLSARTESEAILAGFAAGGVDYVAKPFQNEELLARVKTHLELKHSRDLILEYSQQLVEHNQQLEALNQEKNHFLGIATHDLKNPLSNILTLTQLFKLKNATTLENIADYLPIIERSAHKMLNIIEQLLDVNRIESGGIEVNLRKIDLIPHLLHVAENFKQAALTKSIQIESLWPAGPAWVNTDPQLLMQILDNLVSNAIKYSPAERSVKLRLAETPETYQFSICDQGPGFTEADRLQLFHKFARLSAQPTGNELSTGLGLSIVKLLADLVDAQIDLETSPAGSCFTLSLPRHD